MIKPDYITFSQETFDILVKLRQQIMDDQSYRRTPECVDLCIKYCDEAMSHEFIRWVREQKESK